jgi:cation:H+ antiporter
LHGLLIGFGIFLLWGGGELLVKGARSLARALGLSSLVIGLTVVAFGTSSPELAASLTAVFQGAPDVAFGNVVGSNLANLGLILGLTALLWPLDTHISFVRRELPFLVLASVLLFVVAADLVVTRFEGLTLVALLIVFVIYLLRRERTKALTPPDPERDGPWWVGLLLVAVGVLLLTLGANALVSGAIGIARGLGVSERVIGLTVVAVGTSLPELASCLVAAKHREGDIVLGNLIGSNIFNVLCIIGLTSAIHPFAIHGDGIWIDLGAMLALSILVWPILTTGMRVSRREGAFLLAGYVGYLWFLFR